MIEDIVPDRCGDSAARGESFSLDILNDLLDSVVINGCMNLDPVVDPACSGTIGLYESMARIREYPPPEDVA